MNCVTKLFIEYRSIKLKKKQLSEYLDLNLKSPTYFYAFVSIHKNPPILSGMGLKTVYSASSFMIFIVSDSDTHAC